ncbi:uncharacterized protein BDZ99DRAFT_510334 [Mytilinidion resinicola]|uniref:Tc1-like transposase DDE domain-containing protein n=1 Tax=Mytilinidion resinicola TaxID=574789 RepID=A0A6A6YFE9_9PEZI|nr:uncharacterized protein BDZ99DRAFT_510334 [Mytilinidion resinicola]KAF2807521.1 hypothetical protein BDZ99DRAFT_510334 [Mytilinidion resinicola]
MTRSFGDPIDGNARGNGELLTGQRTAIIAKHQACVSNKELAAEFGCNLRTIYTTIKRFKEHNTTKSLPCSGQPEVLTRRKKRDIIRIRHLRVNGLHKRRCAKRPKLKPEHVVIRRKFAQDYKNFNWEGTTVKFTDKCSVQRGSGQQAEWCFRYSNEKYYPDMITEKDKSNKMSQMVYTKTLEDGLLEQYQPGEIFMHDNAPIHNSKWTKEFLETHELATIGKAEADWTALQEAIKEAWLKLPDLLILSLVQSMPDRIEALRVAKGWQTKY